MCVLLWIEETLRPLPLAVFNRFARLPYFVRSLPHFAKNLATPLIRERYMQVIKRLID